MSSNSVPSEASQLAILASSAPDHEKAVACQKLVYVAGPKSVIPLTALLSDEHLSTYARTGLELIDDPSASQALLDALPKLEGRQLSGVVHSLGVRREQKAVPALEKLATNPARGVQAEAIASLGMIATEEAVGMLAPIIANGKEPLKSDAGHASIIAAEHLTDDGNSEVAKRLVQDLKKAFPEGPIHQAALHLKTDGSK